MIRVTMVYPASPGADFDFDYYSEQHLPLSDRLLKGHGFLGATVQRCISDARGNPPEFLCITHLDFASLKQFQAGMAAHADELRADFERYTNITPIATVCELVPPE